MCCVSLLVVFDFQDEAPEIQALPWLGAIKGFEVIPQQGAIGNNLPAACIAVLIESGQLMIFDTQLKPNPLSLPFQELPEMTVSVIEDSADNSSAAHSVSAERLKVYSP